MPTSARRASAIPRRTSDPSAVVVRSDRCSSHLGELEYRSKVRDGTALGGELRLRSMHLDFSEPAPGLEVGEHLDSHARHSPGL
jgi:hypothetical protein